MVAPIDTRPRPIKDAFDSVGSFINTIASIVVAGVGFGIVTAAESDAVVGLLGLIPGVITALGGVITAVKVRNKAEPQVTPISDPRDHAGNRLRVG